MQHQQQQQEEPEQCFFHTKAIFLRGWCLCRGANSAEEGLKKKMRIWKGIKWGIYRIWRCLTFLEKTARWTDGVLIEECVGCDVFIVLLVRLFLSECIFGITCHLLPEFWKFNTTSRHAGDFLIASPMNDHVELKHHQFFHNVGLYGGLYGLIIGFKTTTTFWMQFVGGVWDITWAYDR